MSKFGSFAKLLVPTNCKALNRTRTRTYSTKFPFCSPKNSNDAFYGSLAQIQKRHQICNLVVIRQMSMLNIFRRKKQAEDIVKKAEGDENEEESTQIFTFEEETRQLTEEEIEAKRNVSRLLPHHRRLVLGEVPYPKPVSWTHHTVKYKRKMYGTYGEKSGINPGIIWPTKSELKEKMEYENICNPFTIQEMVSKKQAQKEAEQAEFERREQEVDKQMSLVEKFKEELLSKQRAKENELEAAKERREKLMEEVRRHFGYTVDPKDERFQELLAKKEKEQRKAMKEARKLEKQKRMLDRLEGSADSKSKSKEKKEKPKVVEDDD